MQPARRAFAWRTAGPAVLSIGVLAQTTAPPAGDLLVYFGTYTNQTSKGVYVSRLDLSSGALSAPQLAAETTNPSFLAAHPTRPFLYAVNEVNTFEGKPSGSVSAFAIDRASGGLRFLNRQPSAGADPAHLVVDTAGRNDVRVLDATLLLDSTCQSHRSYRPRNSRHAAGKRERTLSLSADRCSWH